MKDYLQSVALSEEEMQLLTHYNFSERRNKTYPMRKVFPSLLFLFSLLSCNEKAGRPASASNLLTGTWRLLTGTIIEGGDTTVTDYTKGVSFIKIINQTHFAFLQHDLTKGKDSAASFTAGGGRYTITDSLYTEHLEYCTDRAWEGNDFRFTVTVTNDTLTQQGIEKIEAAGVNRLNIERYVRVTN